MNSRGWSTLEQSGSVMDIENIVGLHLPGPPQPEDRFTTPTPICPHPGYWTSTDGDSTEVEVSDLAYGLVRALQPDFCIETGTGWGQTALRIAQALYENAHGYLVTLEPDAERAEHSRNKLRNYYRAEVLTLASLDWTPDRPIDFAWLDSYYELRVPEFNRYRSYMHPGTIVCFHDSAPGHGSHRIESGRDLRSEISYELIEQVRLIHLPTPRGISIAEVR